MLYQRSASLRCNGQSSTSRPLVGLQNLLVGSIGPCSSIRRNRRFLLLEPLVVLEFFKIIYYIQLWYKYLFKVYIYIYIHTSIYYKLNRLDRFSAHRVLGTTTGEHVTFLNETWMWFFVSTPTVSVAVTNVTLKCINAWKKKKKKITRKKIIKITNKVYEFTFLIFPTIKLIFTILDDEIKIAHYKLSLQKSSLPVNIF